MEKRIFPVKVMNAKGKLKYEIKERDLNTRHWVIYDEPTVLYRKGAKMDYLFARPKPPGSPYDSFE